MSQANRFMLILEHINAVGMAVQILDVMADGPKKDETRSAITRLLLARSAVETTENVQDRQDGN
jgi:hypothetical protein